MTAHAATVIIPVVDRPDELEACLSEMGGADVVVVDSSESPEMEAVGRAHGCKVLKVKARAPEARNIGASVADGDVLGFIDSDCVPLDGWVANALRYFDDPLVGIVTGPTLTPPSQSFRHAIGAKALSTFFGGGIARRRWGASATHETDERSVVLANAFVRRDAFVRAGGFTEWFGSEENILAEKVRRMGLKVVYASDVVVAHKRVPLVWRFVRQVWYYARGRGWMVRRHGSSPFYALPTLGLLVALLAPWLLAVYAFADVVSCALEAASVKEGVALFFVYPLIHLTYAVGFVAGLVARSQKEGRQR